MTMKIKLTIGVGLFTVFLAPGINAAAHQGPPISVASPKSVTSPVPLSSPRAVFDSKAVDSTAGDLLLGTVSDAVKNAPGVPEIVVPAKKQILAEVRAQLKTESRNSKDHSTTTTAFQCPDGEILLTTTHMYLTPPGAKNSPPPPGGYDKLPVASPETGCETIKSEK